MIRQHEKESARETHTHLDLGGLRIEETKRKAGGTGKRLGIIAALLLGALVIAAGVYGLTHRAPEVQVLTVSKPDSGPQAMLNASGYVTPQRRATVAAKITGLVTGIYFEEGQFVHKGYVLAQLDDSDYQKALGVAKADRDATQAGLADLQVQLQNAQIEFHRAQVLQSEGVETQEELDNARMNRDSLKAKIALTNEQVDAADAAIRQAQQGVDNCVIHAPYDGIIVEKNAQIGEMISPISAGGGFTRTGIATIVDMNSNKIEVDVNENYISRVKPHQRAIAVLDAYPDWQIPAHVEAIIPTADRQKATITVRLAFDHLDPRILPDMGVKVTFLGDQPRRPAANLLTVPQAAVRNDGAQKIVYLVKDEKLDRRAVKTGQIRGSDLEILAGLQAGDNIVVGGPGDLHDGEAVRIAR